MIKVVAQYAVRAAMALSVLLAAWWVMPMLRPDIGEPMQATEALGAPHSGTIDVESQVAASPFLFAELLTGHWQFHDSAWLIATRAVSWDEGRRELNAVPKLDLALLAKPRAGEDKLLRLFDAWGSKSTLDSGHTRFAMNVAGIEAVAYAVHQDGQLRLVKATGLTTDEVGKVQLMEMKPRAAALLSATGSRLTMPLPDSAELIATRRDANEQVCAVVANAIIDDADMQTFLQESGWQAERSSMPAGPMKGLGAWICRKGKETVLVMLEPSAASNLLFIVRVPDDTPQS